MSNEMDSVIQQLKELALQYPCVIILPKAPPLTPQQQAEEDAYFADPSRFIDYIGLIR